MTGVSAAARTARKEESREQVALWSLKIERAKGQLANSLVLAGVPRGTPNPVLLRFQPGDGVAVAEAVAGEEVGLHSSSPLAGGQREVWPRAALRGEVEVNASATMSSQSRSA